MVMKAPAMSRRTFVGAGTCVIAATAGALGITSAQAATCLSPENEATVRKYYKLWETKDWRPLDMLLADNFTFTSPHGDDHISKSDFKARCWDTQIDHIQRFDLLQVFGSGNAAFVMYDGFTKKNQTFRNVEFMRVQNGKVESIECYFGQNDSFASAVGTGKK
jgi:ketosteroid isomerase-like protein